MLPRDPERAAASSTADPLTGAGIVLGTPTYMAPEQARGETGAIGVRTDVYALGAILYELACDHPPYAGSDSRDILRQVVQTPPRRLAGLRPDLPPDFVTLVERAMDRDPARRVADARTLGEEVEAFRRGLDLRVYEYGALEQLRRIVRRNRFAAGALAAAILALMAGLVASVLFARAADDAREQAVEETLRTRAALEHAEGQRLAAVASSSVERDPTLALLLGIEAAQRAPGPESSSALHSALDRLLQRREMRGHEGYVYDVGFSSDGARIVSLAEDGTARVWDASRGTEVARIFARRASSCAFSPDSDTLAVVDELGSVTLFSARDGTRQAALDIPLPPTEPPVRGNGSPWTGAFTHVQFTPSGANIAVCTTRGFAGFFSPSVEDPTLWISAARARTIEDPAGSASIAFADDGACLWAEPGATPTLHPAWGSGEGPVTGDFGFVHALAFSADGSRYATAESGRVRIFDADSQQLVREFEGLTLDPNEPAELVLSRDGRRALLNQTLRAYVYGSWRAYDVEAGRTVAGGFGSCRAALDPNGRLIAAIDTEEENAVLLDAVTGERVSSTRGHRYGVTRIAFAPDGHSIATASRDRLVRVFATHAGWAKETWVGLIGREILAFDGPTARAVVRAGPGRAVFVDAVSGAELGPSFPCGKAAIFGVFDARGARLSATALHSSDPAAPVDRTSVIDLERGEIRYELPFASDGVVLGSRGRDLVCIPPMITERDPDTGAELSSIPFDGRLLAASSDGLLLIGWLRTDPSTIQLLDRATGRVEGRLEGHRGLVIDAEFSPDGAQLVTAAADSTARVWNLATRSVERILRWPAIETLRADFDDTGERVLVRSGREVRVFANADGRELVALAFPKAVAADGVGAPIVARLAGFAPDDAQVALCEPDGRVRISPIDPLPIAMASAPRELEPNDMARFRIGDEAARSAYERGYYLRHPSASYQFGLARQSLSEGDADEAVRRARLAVAELPNFAPYQVMLGEALARQASRRGARTDARAIDEAFAALTAARYAGATPGELEAESGLEPLRADPRWSALVAPR